MRKVVVGFGLVTSWLTGVPVASAQQPTIRAQSIDTAIADRTLRLYLSPIRVDSAYRLTPNGYSGATHVEQIVNFAERRDSARAVPVVGATVRAIDTWNGVQFVSPQLAGPFELSGLFSGRLDFITNKQDFDFDISLYELMSSGDYVLVSKYSTQAGAVRELPHRTLLQTEVRQHLDYESDRLPARVIQNGSRLVVLITILRQPALPTDSIADVRELLKIKWYGESFVDLHVRPRPDDQRHL